MKKIMALALTGLMLSATAWASTDVDVPAQLTDSLKDGWNILSGHHLIPEGLDAASISLLETVIRMGDPSVRFLTNDELHAQNQALAGIQWNAGLTIVTTDGLPQIESVEAGGAAAAAGIQAGERLEKIGDWSLSNGSGILAIQEALQAGDTDMLVLGISTEDGVSRTVDVQRNKGTAPAILSREDLPAGLGYLQLAGVFPGMADAVRAIIAKWNEEERFGIILDLRNASGTATEEIIKVASCWRPNGKFWYRVTDAAGVLQEEVPVSKEESKAAVCAEMPLMVLVDAETSGAAELLAAVLDGSVRGALLIGQTTAGNPLVRDAIELPGGNRHAWLAVRQIHTADKAVYNGQAGITPNVVIDEAEMNTEVVPFQEKSRFPGKTPSKEEQEDLALHKRTQNDAFLRRAVDILLSLKAIGYGN